MIIILVMLAVLAVINLVITIAQNRLINKMENDLDQGSEIIETLVRANETKYEILSKVESECKKALQVNDYNNAKVTIRKINELVKSAKTN